MTKRYELKDGYYDGKIIQVPEPPPQTIQMPLISLGDTYFLTYKKQENETYLYTALEL